MLAPRGCNEKSWHQGETGDCHPAPSNSSRRCGQALAVRRCPGWSGLPAASRRDLPSNGKTEVPDSGRGRSPLHPSPHRALCHSAVKMPPIQIQMSLVWNSLNQGPLTKNTLIGWAKQSVEGKQACLGTEDAPHVPLGIKKKKKFLWPRRNESRWASGLTSLVPRELGA